MQYIQFDESHICVMYIFFYEGCENEGEVDAEGETQKIQIQARDTDVHQQDLYF